MKCTSKVFVAQHLRKNARTHLLARAMNLRKHGIVPCIAMLALVGATCTQPTYSVRPQPLRSIFTDYLDSWTRFVNTTLNSLPSHLEPVAADERLCLDHLHRLVTAAAQYQPWAMQSKSSHHHHSYLNVCAGRSIRTRRDKK